MHNLAIFFLLPIFLRGRMAVVFNKSDFAMLVFFGTLCIRPATKSKISARALTQLTSLEKTYGFLFETRSFLPSPSSSLFPPRIGEVLVVIFLFG